MQPQRNVPVTVEQMAINNMVNVEALLEVLIASGAVTEAKFLAAKSRIEQRILDAHQAAQSPPAIAPKQK